MHAQIYNVYQLPMRANEESTKLDKQLRDMKKYLDTEKEKRAQLKNMEQMMQPTTDSEEEPEKHDDGTDVFKPMQAQLEQSLQQQTKPKKFKKPKTVKMVPLDPNEEEKVMPEVQ